MAYEASVTADRGDAGERLDLVLRRHLRRLPRATRTRIQAWIAEGRIRVNGRSVRRASARTAAGDILRMSLPDAAVAPPPAPEPSPLALLYEDAYLMAVDKPAGTVVHPTHRHPTGTLMHALLWEARDWAPGERPSIVGRLDKLTSGLVLVAKTGAAHAALQRALASEDARKEYVALAYGRTPGAGRIDLRLRRAPRDRRRVVASTTDGLSSLTRFVRLGLAACPEAGLSLVACRLITGRMHQIRVHLASCGWPIVGDRTYGEPRWSSVVDSAMARTLRSFPRQALHAWRTELTHPMTGARITIEAPLPIDLSHLIASAGLPCPA